ncbi:uncharacterized protein N7511_010211 [Penicillium nucicola]|uniref:uncharacterized protein n=1 Tax=Penicillium nucicola TaxID=1850975 RepID=UPI002545B343|nr:uncharacterized protein N7511_010211 [Penicillium nucicola]KAJ5748515.1 hypothetical protein N7511_010211 [Penicillium nucicola]
MLFPFMGIFFVGLTLWSQWFPIPGVTDPQESFWRRSIGSIKLTLDVGAVCVLVDSKFPGPVYGPGFPTRTEVFDTSSPVAGTHLTPGPRQVYRIPPRGTCGTPCPQLGLENTSLVDWMTVVFIYFPFVIFDLVFPWLTLLFWLLFYLSYDSGHVMLLLRPIEFIAYTLRYLREGSELFVEFLIDQPQIARVQSVADGSLSVYELTDLLVAGPKEANLDPNPVRTDSMGLLISVLSQAEDVWIHREVMKYIRCKEVEALVIWSQELDCMINASMTSLTAPQNLVVSLVARNSSDVNQETVCLDPDHLPARLWALVPWHPKHLSPFMVSHLVGVLLTSWKEGNKAVGISDAPVDVPRSSDTAPEMEKGHSDTDDDDVSTPVHTKRRNRMSAKARRRKRRQADQMLEEELAQSQTEGTEAVTSSAGLS